MVSAHQIVAAPEGPKARWSSSPACSTMGVLTIAIIALNSLIIATTLIVATFSEALDEVERTSQTPMLDFNKLKDSISSVNWNEYFAKDTSKAVSDVRSNSTNVSYLDPNGTNVQFILFTRNFPPHNLKFEVHQDFMKSGFNFSNPTKIVIHGFLSSTKEDIFVLNRDAYLASGDFNVIGMDWSVLCEFEYFTAMRGAQIAGAALGAFINWIIKEGVPHRDIHIIGHSLGAHVAAMGADKVKFGKVGRVTGLDPAGPGYNSDVPPMYRLDPTDGLLVDVIHTNMRVLSLSHPQGHLDFYPNGGKLQPGCPNMYDIWTIGDGMECNHGRAYHYFAESIRNRNAFKCTKCPNVENLNVESNCTIPTDVHMGREETYQPGVYYLKTNAKPPYSLS